LSRAASGSAAQIQKFALNTKDLNTMSNSFQKSSSFLLPVILFSILFLFFFQLLTDFVAAVYAFGLLQVEIPIEIAFVLLLLSPMLLILFPRWFSTRRAMLALVTLVLICRVAEVLLDTRGQMIVAGIGTASFLIFLPAFLAVQSRESAGVSNLTVGLAAMFAMALSMLLRALNSTVDLSSAGIGQIIAWVLTLIAVWLMWAKFPVVTRTDQSSNATGKGRVIADSFGFVSGLLLLYFAFTAPQVIARWTEVEPLPILAVLVVALCLYVVVVNRWVKRTTISPTAILIWNALFIAALTATIALQQMYFPAERAAYPIIGGAVVSWYWIPLALMLLLSPIIFINLGLFTRQIIEVQLSARTLGIGFSLAALWALIMIFANVSTTVYDYLPVFGPLWRDRYWLVFLPVGLGMALPLFAARKDAFGFGAIDLPIKALHLVFSATLFIGAATLIGAWVNAAKPIAPSTSADTLKVMTYNIQQGYDAQGQKNYDGQLALLRQFNPDVVGLEESDTGRIATGNSDVVRYFADRLGMYSYYGPKTVLGTFGVALLSRYPIEHPRTFYMYSVGEQTATIVAEITAGSKTYQVMVTHLGNGGPLPQLEDILRTLDARQNILLMGDFNFEPTTDQYQQATAVLNDAWVSAGSPGPVGAGWDADQRIDHVFVSPRVDVANAQYVLAPTSDHPALVVEVK
jgi:endonuclease/exonuclease/phosphatase family metal-dependent hydrolase